VTNLIAAQQFGSGGSPSADVVVDTPVNWTITTTPQKFSARVDFPSISGKTLGTNSDHRLQIGVWLPSGATYTVNTAQWQLEPCSPQAPAAGRPTAFEYRGYGAELGRVQRFYQNVGFAGYWSGACTSGWNYVCAVRTTVTMRANPSTTFVSAGALSSFPSTLSSQSSTADLVACYATANGTSNSGAFGFGYTADARL
jgi:hypothetical protein